LLPPWAWEATVARWQAEGLPADCDLRDYFWTDRGGDGAPLRTGSGAPTHGLALMPPLERQVLEDSDEYQIIRDEDGNAIRVRKADPLGSMPQWLGYPVRDREDWEQVVKPRLDDASPERRPRGEDFERWVAAMQAHDTPLSIHCGSLYGWPRCLMGVTALSLAFYDDPGLVHDICEHLTDYIIRLITPFLERVQFDWGFYWEDMGHKTASLCSPATYREFMLPHVERIADLLHAHGVRHVIVDSDGNNDALIPLWLEVGLSGWRPCEIASGCDPVRLRREYGRDLVLMGGVDKRALARGPEAIEHELLSKVPWLCAQGGYFPQVDHLVPPDVSLDNYTHYARLLRAIAEDPERHLHEARRRGYWD
jgi:uroporphyrinogen decarboxylase